MFVCSLYGPVTMNAWWVLAHLQWRTTVCDTFKAPVIDKIRQRYCSVTISVISHEPIRTLPLLGFQNSQNLLYVFLLYFFALTCSKCLSAMFPFLFFHHLLFSNAHIHSFIYWLLTLHFSQWTCSNVVCGTVLILNRHVSQMAQKFELRKAHIYRYRYAKIVTMNWCCDCLYFSPNTTITLHKWCVPSTEKNNLKNSTHVTWQYGYISEYH